MPMEDTSHMVDASGLEAWAVLRELWRNAPLATFFTLPGSEDRIPPEPTKEEYRRYAKTGGVDYVAGRWIKTDFSTFPLLDPEGYDLKVCHGALGVCVNNLRIDKRGRFVHLPLDHAWFC